MKIQVECNKEIVNFPDVTLDLVSNSFQPYRKENNRMLYINKHSNHPNSMKNKIPVMVNKRLQQISRSERRFDTAKGDYEAALVNLVANFRSATKTTTKNQTLKKGLSSKRGEEKSYGLTHPFQTSLRPISDANFYLYWTSIFLEVASTTNSSVFSMNTIKISYSKQLHAIYWTVHKKPQ